MKIQLGKGLEIDGEGKVLHSLSSTNEMNLEQSNFGRKDPHYLLGAPSS